MVVKLKKINVKIFVFPNVNDISEVNMEQIIRKPPNPKVLRRGGFQFPG